MHHPRIDDYTLAEPFWWVGNWDASACEASCEDGGPAQQVGEPGLCLGVEGQLRAWGLRASYWGIGSVGGANITRYFHRGFYRD